VRVTDVAALPFATVAGEKVAVAPVGRPVAAMVTGSINMVVPDPGVNVRANVAVAPAVTVTPVGVPVVVTTVTGPATPKLVFRVALA
jgi:hypothetical protein